MNESQYPSHFDLCQCGHSTDEHFSNVGCTHDNREDDSVCECMLWADYDASLDGAPIVWRDVVVE